MMLNLLGFFIAAILLFNGIPHFVQGICGKTHMTPFARASRPVTNVVWGLINFFAGEAVMRASKTGPWEPPQVAAFWLGAIVISVFLAIFWNNPEARLPWHKD